MKYIKFVIAVLLVSAACGAYVYFKNPFKIEKRSATTIISSLQQTKEIDRFYTGVYHIPVIHREIGELKRNVGLGDKVVLGCCSKKYEVAVGYDHLMKILQDEKLIGEVCAGAFADLPDPQILAINCKNTNTFGKYDSSGECYAWDSDEPKRRSVIEQVMKEDGILSKINERGKSSLKNLITAFCQ